MCAMKKKTKGGGVPVGPYMAISPFLEFGALEVSSMYIVCTLLLGLGCFCFSPVICNVFL